VATHYGLYIVQTWLLSKAMTMSISLSHNNQLWYKLVSKGIFESKRRGGEKKVVKKGWIKWMRLKDALLWLLGQCQTLFSPFKFPPIDSTPLLFLTVYLSSEKSYISLTRKKDASRKFPSGSYALVVVRVCVCVCVCSDAFIKKGRRCIKTLDHYTVAHRF